MCPKSQELEAPAEKLKTEISWRWEWRRHASKGAETPLYVWILMRIFRLTLQKTINIQYPKPGLYIEHLGQGRLDRGMFRIEVKFNKSQIAKDFGDASKVVEDFTNLCQYTTELSQETHCNILLCHLIEQEKQLQKFNASLTTNVERFKRGILGKLLTSVFGVNDEVYQDIKALQQNQEELIKTTNHQSKIMISTLSKINDTEVRIQNQLERFRSKLNQGLDAIHDMQSWYNKVDVNTLNIHTLSAYQIGSNFLSKLTHHYSRILDIQFNRGTLYDLMSPAHVREIIASANQKLPANLRILSSPTINIALENTDKEIQILSSFVILDISNYELIRVTPTPFHLANGSYYLLDISRNLIAIDYNNNLYFELSEEEINHYLPVPNHQYICSPSAVRNIETSPNCVIDEIYERPGRNYCHVRKFSTSSVVWQQLHMPNTWLFLTDKPTRIAVTCSGIREDVLLNITGIIKLSEDCVIKTNQNILQPKHEFLPADIFTDRPNPENDLSVDISLDQIIPENPEIQIDNQLIALKLKIPTSKN
ncbi:unnamed protein product [Psylliodes chrysocephalus]|uniref:Envelope fusion protein n=1 Tax=Psylliodes chrysocephalus TaxID=3402493 RepID=A0A9P0CJQ8_9CUCU|nr:unnamed protein product [Psylliodes chrysocephala]